MAIFTGETVEDAIERGLNRLNVKRENVHIHIEQKEKKGFLGFGKKRARVNIEPIHEETVRKADHLAERGVDDTINLGVPKSQSAMEATLELSQVVKLSVRLRENKMVKSLKKSVMRLLKWLKRRLFKIVKEQQTSLMWFLLLKKKLKRRKKFQTKMKKLLQKFQAI